MYESFYGLRTNPFSLAPDPGFLFLGKRHKLALSLLEYGLLNRAVFSVITGEPGTGKTTLLNAILDQSQHQVTVGVLSNTHAGLGSLMPWVLMAFNLNGKGMDSVELYRTFAAFLAREHDQHRRVVLVVDEAQNLGSAMLEELRLLSNLNDGRKQALQIILSGQPELEETLRLPELRQLRQRIVFHSRLDLLSPKETAAYISRRLAVAGCPDSLLFPDEVVQGIYASSRGIPRVVNLLCEHALISAYAERQHVVSPEMVHRVAADFDLLEKPLAVPESELQAEYARAAR